MGRIKCLGKKALTVLYGERFNVFIALMCGVAITTVVGIYNTKAYAQNVQGEIASSVIRFHVIANSDEKYDQDLKLEVRDTVIEAMGEKLGDCQSIEESREIINNSMEEIKILALEVIKNNGYEYDVNVAMSQELFPQKAYADTVFPSGMYDALRIEIGQAQGYNWWCVMFPPLCFVEAEGELDFKSQQQLQQVLSKEEYEIITSQKNGKIAPKVKLKVVEMWQEKEYAGKKYITKP